jgi:hypothetical protein
MVDKPLWRCPTCGQTFVGRNMPHSCKVRTLDDFFARADPALRALFERFAAAAAERGPVTVNVTKSRIAIQVRGRAPDLPRRDHPSRTPAHQATWASSATSPTPTGRRSPNRPAGCACLEVVSKRACRCFETPSYAE